MWPGADRNVEKYDLEVLDPLEEVIPRLGG